MILKPIELEKTGYVSLSLKNGKVIQNDLYHLPINVPNETDNVNETQIRKSFTTWASVVNSNHLKADDETITIWP
jgi:hypothetical protein